MDSRKSPNHRHCGSGGPPDGSKRGPRPFSPGASLAEINGTVSIPRKPGRLRKMMAFTGPGSLVAVGYMDPGNWATGLAAGSAFGYSLLFVVVLANLMAMLLQALSVRLGIGTGRDLAQACRERYGLRIGIGLWALAELAICATDLAEVIGTAVALNLLFHLPLFWGVLAAALDVVVLLYLQSKGVRRLEALIIVLTLLIGACFGYELFLAGPAPGSVLRGLVPDPGVLSNPHMMLIAIGIVGATVMPHNLYLHSAIVQSRRVGDTHREKREGIRFATLDGCISLLLALMVNVAILVLAASTFHTHGATQVAGIGEAYRLLSPILSAPFADTVFALALLISGVNSTFTGTLAGQVVMEGFLGIRLPPWLRRLVTRGAAIVPAAVVAALYGQGGVDRLLILSQVILGLQLPFAVVPLIQLVADTRIMGRFPAPRWATLGAWCIAALIIMVNLRILFDVARA